MKIRHILCGALLAALLLGSMPFSAVASETPTGEIVDLSGYADGSTYTDQAGISYTVLKSPDTMVRLLRADLTGRYILGADMDMNGKICATPMFGGAAFSGILEGNGHSVTNFSMDSANNANIGLLFHSFTGSPKVADLTVGAAEQPIPFSLRGGVGESVGGLVGAMKNTDAATCVENVTVYSDIVYENVRENTVMIGGIIGKAGPATLKKCRFYGSVRIAEAGICTGYVTTAGGMVGRHNVSEGTLKIIDCENYATIDISNRKFSGGAMACAGGMIGLAEYAVRITGCRNEGDITSDDRSGGILGGIRGAAGSTDQYLTVNCSNTGAVCATRSAGGILGAITSTGTSGNSTFEVSIRHCANTGDIAVITDNEAYLSGGNTGAGGILGTMKYGYLTVSNCCSNATVNCPGKSGVHSPTASGIAGFVYLNSTAERLSRFENCYAVGRLVFGNSAYQGAGLAVASSNSASKGYLLEAVNCYWHYTLQTGSMAGACNMKLSDSSSGNGEKSESEFADGTVCALLGEGYRQTVGTDALPVLLPDTDLGAERVNLFDMFCDPGYFGQDGNLTADARFATKSGISVVPGDILTVASFAAEQPVYGLCRSAGGTPVSEIGAEDLQTVSELGNGYRICSFAIPDGVEQVSITVPAARAYLTLITKNDPFDSDGYYDFYGLLPMEGDSTSPLWGKRALFAGDSISFGYSDNTINGVTRAWAGRLAYHYNMEYVNVSVSGATLSTKYENNRIVSQIQPYLQESFDYVLLEGGINDANPNNSQQNAPLGRMTDGFRAGSFDTGTYAGALEELFCTVATAFPEAKIGFIITYRTAKLPAIAESYANYIALTRQICEKWNVACLNWFEDEDFNKTLLATDTYSFLRDGIHPNATGYDRITPVVADFLESLAPYQPPQGMKDAQEEPTGSGTEEPTTPETPTTGERPDETAPDTAGQKPDTDRPDLSGDGESAPSGTAGAAGCASAVQLCAPIAALVLLGLGFPFLHGKRRRS